MCGEEVQPCNLCTNILAVVKGISLRRGWGGEASTRIISWDVSLMNALAMCLSKINFIRALRIIWLCDDRWFTGICALHFDLKLVQTIKWMPEHGAKLELTIAMDVT
mmetsp:Transcript_12851/g.37753  ORF Transcript_12851/g.37753 Transcript_12851/m.37753 type:complete len:107 (-) Transcript_12851:283-603(-)